MKSNIIVGIDPDVEKSGVAIRFYSESSDIYHWKLENLSFFELLNRLKVLVPDKVFIEAGWLNKSNWHKVHGKSAAMNAKIGERTGANFQVGKLIMEMCQELKLDYQLVRPSQSKLAHQTFIRRTGILIGRTNQEQRDAAMLIFGR